MENNKTDKKEKTKKWLATAGKIAGGIVAVAGAVAGVIYLIGRASADNNVENANDSNDDGETNKYFSPSWLKSSSDEELREKKNEIKNSTDWSGSILDGDYDSEIEAIDSIDEELNNRSWDRYNQEEHSNSNYGVKREHGWYLPNDDD